MDTETSGGHRARPQGGAADGVPPAVGGPRAAAAGGAAEGASADGLPPFSGDLAAFAVQLRRMHGEVGRVIQQYAARQNLHVTDVQALAAILDAPEPMTPTGLRAVLGLTSGAVTACVDRLERAGQVRRVREDTDRRVVHLHYAAAARAAARTHFRPLADALIRSGADFDEHELTVVLRFLTALNDALAEVPGLAADR
ncbi:MarR family winged helix-turn-helix transcriptional regulator [Streptomyces griseofuscus]|uniref:MarR family winged helix-turn-helix transcriptional regulator n=1 Tax=Streptomyces TaxID=1883 RepID=UPI001187CE07|nr:MarR family winged helix-turn-helix transcriptional regulator [Streptomyces murinus]MBA9043582.1 DNA-binding MarR family transcriptional regulator [Streptomyces murinus]BBC98343.1 MarR family transcriptional regulator [Streptomyces rochei]